MKKGRPKGSRNKRTLDLQRCVTGLINKGSVSPGRILTRLDEIAASNDPDRIPAARLLLAYIYGAPRQQQTLTVEHSLSPEAVLREIAAERAERQKLLNESTTVELFEEEVCPK